MAAAAGCAWAEGKVLRYGQALSAHKSIYSLPVALAEREGLFRREGIDFRVVIPVPDHLTPQQGADALRKTRNALPRILPSWKRIAAKMPKRRPKTLRRRQTTLRKRRLKPPKMLPKTPLTLLKTWKKMAG